MIEPRMLAYLEQHNQEALEDWANQHFQWHQRIFTEATKQGYKRYDRYPQIIDMTDLEGWLYYHFTEHIGMANSIGFPYPPDLGDIDPDDAGSWSSWHEAHASIHSDFRTALGIIG